MCKKVLLMLVGAILASMVFAHPRITTVLDSVAADTTETVYLSTQLRWLAQLTFNIDHVDSSQYIENSAFIFEFDAATPCTLSGADLFTYFAMDSANLIADGGIWDMYVYNTTIGTMKGRFTYPVLVQDSLKIKYTNADTLNAAAVKLGLIWHPDPRGED